MHDAHLSPLALDKLATGTAPPELRREAADCPECTRRLEALADDDRALRASPELGLVFETLSRGRVQRPLRFPRRALPWVGAALAASIALVVYTRGAGTRDTQLKGDAFVALVDPRGRDLDAPPRVGDEVALALGTGGHGWALVLEVDAAGQAQELWSGRLSGQARMVLPFVFEVTTPDTTRLWAFFSDEPLSFSEAKAAFDGRPGAPPPPLRGERARASLLVRPGTSR